jgi:four helix bundle protein
MKDNYSFENLECWKQAKDLAVEVHKLSNNGNLNHDYGLQSQLRNSALSVASSIAGGRARGDSGAFVDYLNEAKVYAAALRTQLIISKDIGYLGEGDFLDFEDRINRISAMIGGLIKAIKNRSSLNAEKE